MANRYFIEHLRTDGPFAGEWVELPTRPLYSKAAAQGFVSNLRNAPKGDWQRESLRVCLNGQPIYTVEGQTKRCVKCDADIIDPQLADHEPERCDNCADDAIDEEE